jgi:hypothetical protein
MPHSNSPSLLTLDLPLRRRRRSRASHLVFDLHVRRLRLLKIGGAGADHGAACAGSVGAKLPLEGLVLAGRRATALLTARATATKQQRKIDAGGSNAGSINKGIKSTGS